MLSARVLFAVGPAAIPRGRLCVDCSDCISFSLGGPVRVSTGTRHGG